MPVHMPTRHSDRRFRARRGTSPTLALAALILALLVGLAAARRPSDADIGLIQVEVTGP